MIDAYVDASDYEVLRKIQKEYLMYNHDNILSFFIDRYKVRGLMANYYPPNDEITIRFPSNQLYKFDLTYNKPQIKNVIFNNPATIVYWTDGTKTVVKCDKDEWDPEKGLAMAISKKMLGNEGNYYETFKKWLPEPEKELTLVEAMKKLGN